MSADPSSTPLPVATPGGPSADANILVFDRIEKSYGDVVAVDGVSFAVCRGEVLGLLGPNGAGKTTLIRILMDILRPSAGEVRVFGERFHRPHLDRIGYLPEERGLYLKQKVIDVLVYFGTLKGLDRKEARRRSELWLDRVELPQVASWRVERLSKGMSQKVQIAAALMTEPELCVLDEPFSGLDPVNVRLVKQLIGERRERGLTTILSTHQMSMVEELCDRVALIHRGRLMVYGEVDQVRREHSPLEVELELAAAGAPPEDLASMAGVGEVRAHGVGAWRMVLADGVSPAGMLAQLIRSGFQVERFEPVLAPMEDVFIYVVESATESSAVGASESAEADR